MISFDIGGSGQSLQFAADVLHRFETHRQTRFWHREAGGLLFARFDLPRIDVCEATGPRPTDRRSRYSYRPDEEAEKAEIEANFSRGLHFVGCWHTHPEDIASPSTLDTRNISDCVRRSHHALNGFVMVIVGRAVLPDSMFVSICDRSSVHELMRSAQVLEVPTHSVEVEPASAAKLWKRSGSLDDIRDARRNLTPRNGPFSRR